MPEEIVGRGVELAAVERFVDRATRSFAALVLEGEAGIGKTTLWDAALAAARSRGWLILSSRPVRSEQGLTLGGLSDVFGGLDDLALAGLPEPQRHALEVALLRVAPSGSLPDQRALSVAVAGLLRSLTSPERPVLLALDDAQWLDESSAAIFAYAIRRLSDRPLGLVVSVRAGRRPRPRTGSWRRCRSIVSSGSPWVPCRSARSTGCSRPGSAAPSRVSSSSGSRPRRGAIRSTRSRSREPSSVPARRSGWARRSRCRSRSDRSSRGA